MPPFDPKALRRVQGTALAVVAYRNQARGYDPRTGEGARRLGGRFNPPNSFPVLYLCLTKPCVVTELTRQAQRQSLTVADLLPRELWQVDAELDNVLDLTDAAVLVELDLAAEDLVRVNHQVTREIGEAAHEQGFQAIRSASATGVDDVLAVFPERLAGAVLEVKLVGEWTSPDDLLGDPGAVS